MTTTNKDPYQRVPHTKPPFTFSQLKNSIPPHCFHRPILRSLTHLLSDLATITFLYFLAQLLPLIFLPFYWFFQGFALTGLWILAHEAGHHAFTHQYPLLNDFIGFLIHSSLLVPYFSWKLSHRLHHANINCMEKDESFVPKLKTQITNSHRMIVSNPIGRILILLTSALLGWPLYLLINLTGRSYPRWACHFDPYSPMFEYPDRILVIVSDIGVLISGYGFYYQIFRLKGVEYFMKFIVLPLLVMNGIVVCVIYLHHTHPSLPRYKVSEWDWLRGALGTVDRDYGRFFNNMLHHIADTHTVHHLFPMVPHYHAVEATAAVKGVLGEYYQFDGTPILRSLWREVRDCEYVESRMESEGVLWFSNGI